MITNDNLSVKKVYEVLKANMSDQVVELSDHVVTVVAGDNTFLVSAIGSAKIMFFKASTVNLDSCSSLDRLRLANTMNSDMSHMSTAYLDEEDMMTFKHSISVSGGIDEFNLVFVALEFQIESLLLDQIVKNHLAGMAS